MAEIVLLDKNSNKTEYKGTRYLSVPTSSGDKTKYMSLDSLLCYWGQMDKVSDDVYTFTPRAIFIAMNTPHAMLSTCTDTAVQQYGRLEESGQYQMAILFSHRRLDVDQTYRIEEL